MRSHDLLGIAQGHTGQIERAHFGQVDPAIAVNHKAFVDFCQAVDLHHHLVTRAQDVACRHRRGLGWGKGGGFSKQIVAIER